MGMDPVTASIVGPIAGSAIGGLFGNKTASQDRAAMAAANAASNQGYTDARPFITDLYGRGKSALEGILSKGMYAGDTYAAMNPTQTAGYNALTNLGNVGINDGTGFMNTGRDFAQNYANLYNQASQDMLSNAVGYATNPANYQPLLDAATRDSRRNLEENTLRGIDVSASASGNTNSSRAGIADAVAARGFADREADTAAQIQNNLINRSLTSQQNQLSNMTTANQNLAGLYGMGTDQAQAGAGMLTTAGEAFRTDQQNQFNDQRDRFERERDFTMDQLNQYNAGILGQAPRTPAGYTPNLVNPTAATLSGAMGGFGIGGKIADYFSRPRTMGYGTTGATGMSRVIPYTDNMGFGVG